VDFDGVLAEPADYPKIGKPKQEIIGELVWLKKEYGYSIWLYTCRDWWQEDDLRRWCDANGVPIDGIICGKPLGIIVDDLSINPDNISLLDREILRLNNDLNDNWVKK